VPEAGDEGPDDVEVTEDAKGPGVLRRRPRFAANFSGGARGPKWGTCTTAWGADASEVRELRGQPSDFPEIACGTAIAPVHRGGQGALKMVEAVRDHWLITLAVVLVVGITAWLLATRR